MDILIKWIACFAPFALFAECFYFIPPAGWQCVEPKASSSYIQVGFVTKSSHGFCPSINLATESVDSSLKDYVKAVKEIHLSQPNTQWRDLGSFAMKEGKGRLTEISHPSPWGPVQKLQALFIREKVAYILTAAALREEFPLHRKEIVQALKSLTFAPDLISALPNKQQQSLLQQALDAPTQPPVLQHLIAECAQEMGAHWAFLVLKELHAHTAD